jgi:hypothetical protein
MRIWVWAVFTVVSLVPAVGSAQQPQKRAAQAPAAKINAFYSVAINTPQGNVLQGVNPNFDPIIVVARCNATNNPKDLEGWVSQSTQATVADMVGSQSGTGRQTITFLVPWGWNYRVNVAVPPGGSCTATAWPVG